MPAPACPARFAEKEYENKNLRRAKKLTQAFTSIIFSAFIQLHYNRQDILPVL